jgi:hypothetical protein
VLAGKRLELLKETIPKFFRVAVLWNPRIPALHNNGKRAKFQGENWVSSFILWK